MKLRSAAITAAFILMGFSAGAAPASNIEGVYLSSIQFGTTLDFQFYTLYKDGRAFNGVPPDGPEALDLATAQKANPATVGTWKEAGGSVTIAWGGGREASAFPRRSDGSLDLKRGVSTRLAPLPDGQKLGGNYSRLAVAKGGGTMVSGSKSVSFRPDGTFSGSMVGAVSVSGAGGKAAERRDEGTYAIKGYTVTFTGGSGPSSQLLATYKSEPPTAPEIIFLGGGYMLKK